jgi:maltose phosphorylase
MYYPFWEEKQLFLQQDGFLDKDLVPVADLDPAQRPINQKWSWDRILRSPYIKQADTLQGMFFFEDRTDRELLRRHFDFYEPFTVHESSLSPSVHTILATRLGYAEQAYAFYLRTARLDLDDYNHEVREGLHVTAMGGAWMSVVHGFGGMRLVGEQLTFEPALPAAWTRLAFHLVWRGATLHVELTPGTLTVNVVDGPDTEFGVGSQTFTAKKGTPVIASV